MANIRIKRGTRAQLDSGKNAGTLAAGEPYLITDESRIAVGTATNAYAAAAIEGHGHGDITSILVMPVASIPAAGSQVAGVLYIGY